MSSAVPTDVVERRPSRTAVFVCQGRAVADGRLAVGRFSDPVAIRLLRADELVDVESARSAAPPEDWRRRLAVEALHACADVVVPRTVAIDEAMRTAANAQVVILGAGLDTRPWRMDVLADAAVVLVDHPASQNDARARTARLEAKAGRLTFVSADLARESLARALEGAQDPSFPTTWVWEGVVPYLEREAVMATVSAIAGRSAPGSVLVATYQTHSLVNTLGRRAAQLTARLARSDDPLAGEPWRSLWSPDAMRRLLHGRGFRVVDDRDLLTVATEIGSPTRRRRSLRAGRMVVAGPPG